MLAVNFTACGDNEDGQTIIEQANLIGMAVHLGEDSQSGEW